MIPVQIEKVERGEERREQSVKERGEKASEGGRRRGTAMRVDYKINTFSKYNLQLPHYFFRGKSAF